MELGLLSANPNITFENVMQYPEKEWEFSRFSYNKFKYNKYFNEPDPIIIRI